MKFFFNALLAIIILSAGIFGLHKTGVIIFNTANDQALSGSIEGTISDMPIEEDRDLQGEIENASGDLQEDSQKTNYLSVPYPDIAEIGTFTELGKISTNIILYSYKVKLGGNIGGVENKWEAFIKGSNLTGKVIYTNSNGDELNINARLDAGETVYVKLNTEIEGTTIINTESKNPTAINTKPSPSKACATYSEFFECILSKVSGADPDIMRNNLNAFIDSISTLSVNDQEAKCTNLIYEIKSKSTSTANQTCIEIIK